MGGRTTTKPGQDMGPTSLEKNNYLFPKQGIDAAEGSAKKLMRER